MQCQDSLTVVEDLPDALYIGNSIVYKEVKTDTMRIDSTKEIAKGPKQVAVLDTQRIIMFDTVRVTVEKAQITDKLIPPLIPKTETAKKETVTPLGDIIA